MDAPAPHDEFFVHDADPNYVYKWCNTRERVMLARSRQGYEVVTEPEKIPEAIRLANPQSPAASGETVRRRGDLILMRIRKDLHEKNVKGPVRAAKERHGVSLDTMIQQADENTKRRLRAQGYSGNQIRTQHVFPESEGPHRTE